MTAHNRATIGAVSAYLRLALVSRLIEPSEIEHWATGLVASMDRPPLPVCELAVAARLDENSVLENLRAIARTDADLDTAWAMFCRHLHAALAGGTRNAKETIYILFALDSLGELPAHMSGPVSILEDEYSLARDRVWGTLDQVHSSTLHLLSSDFDHETPSLAPDAP